MQALIGSDSNIIDCHDLYLERYISACSHIHGHKKDEEDGSLRNFILKNCCQRS